MPGILQLPTTQLAKMSIDPKFVELTADVLKTYVLCNIARVLVVRRSRRKKLNRPASGLLHRNRFFFAFLQQCVCTAQGLWHSQHFFFLIYRSSIFIKNWKTSDVSTTDWMAETQLWHIFFAYI